MIQGSTENLPYMCACVCVCVYLVDLGWVVLILLSCKSCLYNCVELCLLTIWLSEKANEKTPDKPNKDRGEIFPIFCLQLQNYLRRLSSRSKCCSCHLHCVPAIFLRHQLQLLVWNRGGRNAKAGRWPDQGQAQQCCLVESTGDSWWSTAWVDGMIWNGSK